MLQYKCVIIEFNSYSYIQVMVINLKLIYVHSAKIINQVYAKVNTWIVFRLISFLTSVSFIALKLSAFILCVFQSSRDAVIVIKENNI